MCNPRNAGTVGVRGLPPFRQKKSKGWGTEGSFRNHMAGLCTMTGIMKGNATVLEHLNHALRDELTAINQYFLHAEMAENWGYKKYSKYIKKQSLDEMKHAELLMERILFLDGSPTMEPMALMIGKSVKDMIES